VLKNLDRFAIERRLEWLRHRNFLIFSGADILVCLAPEERVLFQHTH
jgi:hypothetical protein